MTIGNLIVVIGILLFMPWSAYSIKDYVQNSHNISYTTTMWLSLMTSLFIVSIIFFIVYFWDYKLF